MSASIGSTEMDTSADSLPVPVTARSLLDRRFFEDNRLTFGGVRRAAHR